MFKLLDGEGAITFKLEKDMEAAGTHLTHMKGRVKLLYKNQFGAEKTVGFLDFYILSQKFDSEFKNVLNSISKNFFTVCNPTNNASETTNKISYIKHLEIDKAFRGLGLGKLLIKAIKVFSFNIFGATAIMVESINQFNAQDQPYARSFLEKFGFESTWDTPKSINRLSTRTRFSYTREKNIPGSYIGFGILTDAPLSAYSSGKKVAEIRYRSMDYEQTEANSNIMIKSKLKRLGVTKPTYIEDFNIEERFDTAETKRDFLEQLKNYIFEKGSEAIIVQKYALKLTKCGAQKVEMLTQLSARDLIELGFTSYDANFYFYKPSSLAIDVEAAIMKQFIVNT